QTNPDGGTDREPRRVRDQLEPTPVGQAGARPSRGAPKGAETLHPVFLLDGGRASGRQAAPAVAKAPPQPASAAGRRMLLCYPCPAAGGRLVACAAVSAWPRRARSWRPSSGSPKPPSCPCATTSRRRSPCPWCVPLAAAASWPWPGGG